MRLSVHDRWIRTIVLIAACEALPFPPVANLQGGFFLTPARGAISPVTAHRRSMPCYWLPLPRERAGVRGRHRP